MKAADGGRGCRDDEGFVVDGSLDDHWVVILRSASSGWYCILGLDSKIGIVGELCTN